MAGWSRSEDILVLIQESGLEPPAYAACFGDVTPAALHEKGIEGAAALHDLVESIQKSGLEPQAYVAQFRRNSGLSSRKSEGMEYMYLVPLRYMFTVLDGLDPYTGVSKGHLASGCLLIQGTVQRNPRTPLFVGLEECFRQAADGSGAAVTVGFDRQIADCQQAKPQIPSQQLLQRGELEPENKRHKNWDGGGLAAKREGKNDKAPKGGGKGADPG